MILYLCTHEEHFGIGASLKEAFDTLEEEKGWDVISPEACNFYEIEKIEVEFKIVKKETVSKITKKVP